MYRVLYRKWRPKTFSDVCGQPQVTVTLKNQLNSNRISHAYLFTGSRGTGKTSCAKILAKAVNCLNPIDGDPCCECSICKGIDKGSVMDIVEIDAASNNGVNDVRALIDELVFTPNEAKYRVYIIDEVHMLSKPAFNALLKTLEEPPEHVIFILATTEVHELPATILSRCQRFDFNRISPDEIASRLKYVAKEENAEITDDAALLIGAVSDGALRDALSLLDRAMSIKNNVDSDAVREAAGLADKGYLFSIAEAISSQNYNSALSIVDSLHKASKDESRLCKELVANYRTIMLIKLMKAPQEIVVLTDDEYRRAKAIAISQTPEKIVYCINTLQSASEKISRGADARTELELALIKLCSPELDDSVEALLARVSRLELAVRNGIKISADAVVSKNDEPSEFDHNEKIENKKEKEQHSEEPRIIERPVYTQTAVNQPSDTPAPPQKPSQPVSLEQLKENAVIFDKWQDVIKILNKYSKAIAAAFDNTTAYISGDYLLIDTDNEMPFLLLKQSAQRDKVRVAVREVTGRTYKLGPYNPKKEIEKSDPLAGLIKKVTEQGIDIKTDNMEDE